MKTVSVHDPSKGFWIFPDGREEPIRDHYNAVRANPEKYGLIENDIVTDESFDKARASVLLLVMQKGYIRVRGQVEYTLMAFWCMSSNIALNIRQFLASHQYRDNDRVLLSDLSTKGSGYVTVRYIFTEQFMKAAKNNDMEFQNRQIRKLKIKGMRS